MVLACNYLLCALVLIGNFVWLVSASNSNRKGHCSNSDAYYFNVQPKSIQVRQGGRAFLECNVSNRCDIRFHWTLNGRNVLNTTRRYQNGSNLVITRVDRFADKGDWHCIATYAATGISKESQPAQLYILWLSSNVTVSLESPHNTSVLYANALRSLQTDVSSVPYKAAESLTLFCNASGSDELNYKWMLNGRKIKTGSKSNFVHKSSRLTISKPQIDQNGVYSCEVDNEYGVQRSTQHFVLALTDWEHANISVIPEDVIGRKTASVIFHCDFHSDEIVIEWRKVDNQKASLAFDTTGRMRHLANGSLVIDDIAEADQGFYECSAYPPHDAKMAQSFAAKLTVASLSPFSSTSFEPVQHLYVVGIAKRFEIACVPPAGNPAPSTYWMRHDTVLTNGGRVRADGVQLVIDSAEESDEGEYKCVTENMAGRYERKLELHTSQQAHLTRHPASLTATEDENVYFVCEFKGTPYPVTVIDWEFNGHAISAEQRGSSAHNQYKALQHLHVNVQDNSNGTCSFSNLDWGRERFYFLNNGTLAIHSIRPSDTGQYVCVVKSADQDDVRSRPAQLTVIERLKFDPRPVDRSFEKGANVRIECQAKGPSPPEVHWMQIGRLNMAGQVIEEFSPREQMGADIRSDNGTLYFRKIDFTNAGVYMCVAVSKTQGVINATIKVQVYVMPVFSISPSNVTTAESADAVFHCAAQGKPQPQVLWYFDRVPVEKWPFNNYQLFANGTLIVRSVTVRNAGKLECVAGNAAGLTAKHALLCVRIVKTNFTHCGREVGIQTFDKFNGDTSSNAGVHGVANASDSSVSIRTITIACSAAAGYMLLVVCLLGYCGYRRKKFREDHMKASGLQPSVTYTAQNTLNDMADRRLLCPNGDQLSFDPALGGGLQSARPPTSNTTGSLPPPVHYSSVGAPSPRSAQSPRSSLPPNHITLTRNSLNLPSAVLLGNGVYGPVMVSSLLSVRADAIQFVLIKQLKNKDENVHQMLKEEMELYTKCDHQHVFKMLALFQEEEPVLAVFEYSDWGILKSYLALSRHYRGNNEYPKPLTEQQAISVAYQIAQGMEHISDQRFVHKDVAARNVLVCPNMNCKIGTFSMQEDTFTNEYYTFRMWPVRWMAPEPLLDDDYSMKSDVWAFGVLLWELFTCGELPHQNLSNEELVNALKADNLEPLLIPDYTPEPAAELMLQCWQTDPRLRPTFTQCRDVIGQLHVENGMI